MFIGPVQIVEDYLNYTKFNYFSLYDVAELRVGDERKNAPEPAFRQFPEVWPSGPCGKLHNLIVMSPLGCVAAGSIPDPRGAAAQFC